MHCGLRTADCGLRTTYYGLGIKHRFMYNITQYMYKRDQTLSYARALRSFHLFLPLLKGHQFHAYLTAQAQNAFPRIFVFLTYQAYQNSDALFNLRLLLVRIIIIIHLYSAVSQWFNNVTKFNDCQTIIKQ